MSVCAQKVRMVLDYKNIEWQGEHLNLRAGEQFNPGFRAKNPKAMVPVLEHEDKIITESNIIVEYLEDVFPEQILISKNPFERALVRRWLIQLDAGLHEQVAVISFCLAFRYQMLDKYKTEKEMEQFIENIPDPGRAAVMRDTIVNGHHSSRLKIAVFAYNKLLNEMSNVLNEGEWLVGNQLSAADIGFLPYLDRLDQLGLSAWWQDKPQIQIWLDRLREAPAYKTAIKRWLNADYLKMMEKNSEENWSIISSLI
jgi:glutathione S-transferase